MTVNICLSIISEEKTILDSCHHNMSLRRGKIEEYEMNILDYGCLMNMFSPHINKGYVSYRLI